MAPLTKAQIVHRAATGLLLSLAVCYCSSTLPVTTLALVFLGRTGQMITSVDFFLMFKSKSNPYSSVSAWTATLQRNRWILAINNQAHKQTKKESGNIIQKKT